MKIIDIKLFNAFVRMKAALVTDTEVARVLGISCAHVGRILKGKTKYLSDETWERVEPTLSLYIRKDDVSNVERVGGAITSFPVISDSAAAQNAGTCYYPISDWADEYAEERISFSQGRAGDFVIRVTGDSMLPWYPNGTLVLVRPNVRVNNGERVVAVLADGSVVFKIFAEKGDYIHLFSVNSGDGKDFHFKKDENAVRAVYPVIQSMRDERALDRAMSDSGIHHGWEEKLKSL